MNYTQNFKIEQVKESTLVVGIDIGSQTHFARAFDWRGRELTKKVFSFSSSLEGFINFHDWVKQICERNGKTDVSACLIPLVPSYLPHYLTSPLVSDYMRVLAVHFGLYFHMPS